MKMVFLVYSHVADDTVITALKHAGIKAYTKVERACGEGTETEPKLHTHTWPGENHLLFLAVDDADMATVTGLIRTLKEEHPRAGVKGFILPLVEII